MRAIHGATVTRKKRRRRVTKRFVCLMALSLAVIMGITLFRIIPSEISKAADGSAQTGEAALEMAAKEDDGKIKIIIDPGHGDTDVGTKGVSTGRLEKEVNLEIAQKLKAILQQEGYEIIMTRDSDEPIAAAEEPSAQKRKTADMKKRETIIEESHADVFVSIHQNFYEKGSSAHGPQVFYHDDLAKGYGLAQNVQSALNEMLKVDKPREISAGDYQLLRPGDQASIIVECGFFSNPQEERKLQESEYQQRVAQAIATGIKEYLDTV